MLAWLQKLIASPRALPDELWQHVLSQYPFLTQPSGANNNQLRQLTAQFLAQKQFSGAHGLEVTDEMAVAIAAQACLPILHLSLKLYDDFKGIVVHPGAMVARRTVVDAAGVHHFYKEELAGEVMQNGPVTLSWQDVVASSEHLARGYNVVIHEFVHKLDMRDGTPNGCPPLASRQTKLTWQAAMQCAYETFKEKVVMAERFGGELPWLDAYAATSPAEFFAVTSEAYFVSPDRFAVDFPALVRIFDAFYKPKKTSK